jgi:uncharacterized protein HemX
METNPNMITPDMNTQMNTPDAMQISAQKAERTGMPVSSIVLCVVLLIITIGLSLAIGMYASEIADNKDAIENILNFNTQQQTKMTEMQTKIDNVQKQATTTQTDFVKMKNTVNSSLADSDN